MISRNNFYMNLTIPRTTLLFSLIEYFPGILVWYLEKSFYEFLRESLKISERVIGNYPEIGLLKDFLKRIPLSIPQEII